jgi:hypothetical protein
MQLDSAKAKVLVVGGLLIGFLGRWWHIVAELEDELHTLAAVAIEVVVFGYVAEVGWVVGVVLMVRLPEWRLLPLLLLAKDLDGVLELHESFPFFINMLTSGFGTLICYLPSCDGFLFMMEPLYLLLNPG